MIAPRSLTVVVMLAAFGAQAFGQSTADVPNACHATNAPALDHAIIAVGDLSAATDAFRSAGFRIKRGRLHANGLLNNHVKFPDGTEIELMTVQGNAGDAMAGRYADVIARGDGGIYVALKTPEIDVVDRHARSLGLSTRRSSSGPWQFLGFNDTTAATVFFTSGGGAVQDADSIFRHEPRVTGLAEVWIEGGAALERLLVQAGAAECGTANGPDQRSGRRFGLQHGSVVVVPARGSARPRVLGAVLETPHRDTRTIRPVPQFWIRYR
ncbi:MAG TPA: VOC family protein [Longimicrobiales bacterium]